MAITQAMATSFKVQLLNGQHNFSANTFKLALYTSSATINENTTAYSATNEVASTGNYSAGGNTLSVSVTPTNSGNVAFISFANTFWANATITANGALIYNSNLSNAAVCVLAFGGDKSSTNGTFAVNFPTADASNAIIRLTAS
jgi:hypothetical protein